MKNKIKLLLAIILSMAVIPLSAQNVYFDENSDKSKMVEFMIRGGLNYSNLRNNEHKITNTKTSYNIGVFADIVL